MLKLNDVVLYGSTGACRVREFCKKRIAGIERDYAVLETQVPPKATIYLPLENPTLMGRVKRVISPEEMRGIIRQMPAQEELLFEDEDQRKQRYQEILSVCEHTSLIRLIKTLSLRQQEQRSIGKKLHSADERTYREAQRLLHNEISFVMGISPDEVASFISSELAAQQTAPI